MATMKRQDDVRAMLEGTGWLAEFHLQEREGLWTAQAYLYPDLKLRKRGEESIDLTAHRRDPDEAEAKVVEMVREYLDASPKGRLIMRLMRETREMAAKYEDLRRRADEMHARARRLQIEDLLEARGELLRSFLWRPTSLTFAPFSGVRLTAEGDEVDIEALHSALGQAYHGTVVLADGVHLTFSDGDIHMLTETVQALLDFTSTHRLRIDWQAFRDHLAELDRRHEDLEQARTSLRELVGLVEGDD